MIYDGVVKPIATVPSDHRFLDTVLTFIQTDLLDTNVQQSEGNGRAPVIHPTFVVYDPVSDFTDIVFWVDRNLENRPNPEVFRVRNSNDPKDGSIEYVQADTLNMKLEAEKDEWYSKNYPLLAVRLTRFIAAVRQCHNSYWSGLADSVIME